MEDLDDHHFPIRGHSWNYAKISWTKLRCEWNQIWNTNGIKYYTIVCTNYPQSCQEVVWVSSDLFHPGISSWAILGPSPRSNRPLGREAIKALGAPDGGAHDVCQRAAWWLQTCTICKYVYTSLLLEYLENRLNIYNIHTYIYICICISKSLQTLID